MLRLFLLDNHDSFTWNVAHALEDLGARVVVATCDAVEVEWVGRQGFDAWVISPGPGRPEGAGISLDLVRVAGETPLLGVCLGHQAIGMVYGARVVRAARLMHGKTSEIHHDGRCLFRGLSQPFTATRYHSLALDPSSIGPELVVTAHAEDREIMGIRHRRRPTYGVQFHPESVLTAEGRTLFRNFLALTTRCKRRRSSSACLPGTWNDDNKVHASDLRRNPTMTEPPPAGGPTGGPNGCR